MSNTLQKPRFGLNSNQLRFLALALMLLDHMWATVTSGQLWMTCVGRLAFPIFAFQIAQGYLHTHDWKAYAKRLFWFGVISEIPFNLMISFYPVFPFHQNVMFTLLLGLCAIHWLDVAWQIEKPTARWKPLLKALGCILLGGIGLTDYGMMGVVTVILFWVCTRLPYGWAFQLAGMILLNVVAAEGQTLPLTLGSFTWDMPLQAFAVLALPLIWLYNGQKGRSSKALQYAAYAFYPVHMLVLALLVMIR